jgi:hypothetical protein
MADPDVPGRTLLWSWGESAQLFVRSASCLLDGGLGLKRFAVRSNRRSNGAVFEFGRCRTAQNLSADIRP